MNFELQLPTKIYFGENFVDHVLQKENENFCGNIMIVSTGGTLLRNGSLFSLRDKLQKLPRVNRVYVYTEVSPNPDLKELERAVEIGRQENVQLMVGFGGGSSLDAAKAIAVGIAEEISLEEYLLNGLEPSPNTLPIVAIPTTAGTGSELSKAAIVSSKKHGIKGGIRGDHVLPKLAIVDCAYTFSVPKKVTMETGFDVLAHGIESYVAVKANLLSDTLSEKAIRIVGEYLPKLYGDLNNREARKQMCYASTIMGINLANVGTALPHRMQYPIGAATECSHAAGLAAMYPSWIGYQFMVNRTKIENVFQWLGYPKPSSKEEAVRLFDGFLKSLEIAYGLSQFGIEKAQIDKLTRQVTGNLTNDLLAKQGDIIYKIYYESME